MTAVALEQSRAQGELNFGVNLAVALVVMAGGAFVLLYWQVESPFAHTILDTSVFVTGALVALLLWDISTRTTEPLPLFLAISFAVLAVGELLHTLAALEWLGANGEFGLSEVQWRAGTWGPPAHLLPAGVGAALLLRGRSKSFGWLQIVALAILAVVLFLTFQVLSRYTEPGLLGVTRPTLVFVPLLWVAVGFGYWQLRQQSEVAHAVALTAVILVVAHSVMLYSRAPNDPVAMVSHLGKFVGDALLLLSLMQIGTADTSRRQRAERELTDLNRDLDARVRERTDQLQEANADLKRADQKLKVQLDRMNLLNQITHAVGERQDIQSIFQVVVRNLEDQLPADFVGICLYDPIKHLLTVAHVGVKSAALARELAMAERAQVAIDENGLSRCVRGQLVYEPDIAQIDFPFPRRLATQGLRSLIAAPLIVDKDVFGAVIVARLETKSFSSTDCEFLHQLSEHVALAARQAQLHSSLQQAYDDLRQTQQAVMQQERLRALGQMASGIAHDINNAISPISLYTDSLLESERGLSDRTREYLRTVKRVIDDVAGTIGRLREFYRERDTQSEAVSVDLNELVQQVVELTRARWSDIPQRQGVVIVMQCSLEDKLPPVMVVDYEIREALTNLIFNAVDAQPDGGAIIISTRSVVTSASSGDRSPKRQVQLEVSDRGFGMDEATRRRCMEPFFTTKGERGTGLGLAMVYGAIKRHNAEIDIESAVGRGTTVRISLAADVPASTAASKPDAEPILTPMNLLIIDDDPFVLDSMRTVLELDGHAVISANGAREGIAAFRTALAQSKPFEAVITDLGMPHMDGHQVARTIKGLAQATPVVLLTGWGRRMQAGSDASSYVDYYLGKPAKLEELRDVLVKIRAASA